MESTEDKKKKIAKLNDELRCLEKLAYNNSKKILKRREKDREKIIQLLGKKRRVPKNNYNNFKIILDKVKKNSKCMDFLFRRASQIRFSSPQANLLILLSYGKINVDIVQNYYNLLGQEKTMNNFIKLFNFEQKIKEETRFLYKQNTINTENMKEIKINFKHDQLKKLKKISNNKDLISKYNNQSYTSSVVNN